MPPRDSDFFTRGGTPRLRLFLEEYAAGQPSKADAARILGLTPAELSNFTSGERVPSPQKVLNIVSNLANAGTPPRDFLGCLDQILIESGYAPAFFHRILSNEKQLLLFEMDGDFFSLKTEPASDALLMLLSDLRIVGRKGEPRLARVDGTLHEKYFLLEEAYDDSDLDDGDVALLLLQGRYCFAKLHRKAKGAEFTLFDPASERNSSQLDNYLEPIAGEIGVLARVLLEFSPLNTPSPGNRPRSFIPHVRTMDKLRVGISPFQDALLSMVGVELGIFEEEGLLVRPERVAWYDWPDFLRKGQEQIPCIVFSNIYTFVEKFTYTNDIRFLYGVNLFNKGFKLIEKIDDGGSSSARRVPISQRILGDEEDMIEIATIGNSDWAAQLYSFCRARRINLAYESARGLSSILPEKGKYQGRPTLVIIDTTRQAGVENNPLSIHDNYSVYLGSIPQRMSLVNQFGWRVIEEVDLGEPYPVNGFVGSAKMLTEHLDIFLRFLRCWFRIVNYIQPEIDRRRQKQDQSAADADTGSRIVERAFDNDMFPDQIAKLKIISNSRQPRNEIVNAWNEELFPRSPFEIKNEILGIGAASPWRNDAHRAMDYISAFSGLDQKRKAKWDQLLQQLNSQAVPCEENPFALEYVQQEYVARYGTGEHGLNFDQQGQSLTPESLSLLGR